MPTTVLYWQGHKYFRSSCKPDPDCLSLKCWSPNHWSPYRWSLNCWNHLICHWNQGEVGSRDQLNSHKSFSGICWMHDDHTWSWVQLKQPYLPQPVPCQQLHSQVGSGPTGATGLLPLFGCVIAEFWVESACALPLPVQNLVSEMAAIVVQSAFGSPKPFSPMKQRT
jgi:hypothetical protein